MKRTLLILVLGLAQLIRIGVDAAPQVTRQHLLIDQNWKFIQSDVSGAEATGFNDAAWRTLNLPHDWSIEGEFSQDATTKGQGGYLPTGVGWYRKHLEIKSFSKDQRYWIEFDGVYMNSDVWINGHHLGKHPYGYTSFYYDLTSFIRKGDNIIAVRVDNSAQPNSRWYSGSGIYRHVWLNVSGTVHVAQWGTYITTPVAEASGAKVSVRTTIENNTPSVKNIVLRSTVTDKTGKSLASVDTPVVLAASGKTDVEQSLNVGSPELWSIESPSLYSMQSSVLEGNKEIDRLSSPFGIRKIEFDTDKGFLLNGKHIKMNGVCLHHDAGCLGAAVPDRAWERRLQLLKEMGCNAIRASHNPTSPEFLDLCDRMGFLVMDEIFDEWVEKKGQITSGYHLYFEEWWKSDVISMIHRDRNHPSVVIWSAGNEVPDQVVDKGIEVMRKLSDLFHKEDPTRPVTQANDRIAAGDGPAKIPFLELQDIVGYNYVDRWNERRELYYSIDRHDHPGWKMIGTENGSVGGLRGQYSIGSVPTEGRPGRSRDYRTGMIQAEQLWKFTLVNDYVIGDFMWTGIDYLGEASWPNKNASSGVIDLCGFPKDGFYFYQSQWTEKPMIHILPHWNWSGNEGKIIPVIVYTNCDTAELFLNGKSYGRKSYVFPQQGHSKSWNGYERPYIAPTTSDLHLSWDLPYEPGTVKIVGRKDGKTITEELRSTSAPAAIRLTADRSEISADMHDIVNIKVEIIDANGLVVPTANNAIEFKVDGEGVLIGTDNGNPSDKTQMKSKKRSAFNGLALAVVQSTEKGGNINISASSDGLKDAIIQIVAQNEKDRKQADPVTPNASPEARALLNYICSQYGKKTLSGQMWAPWAKSDEIQTVFEITGKYPAIRGQDYINERANKRENQLAAEWWKAGGIPTIMWHWGAPSIGEGYENSKKAINIDSCFIAGTKQNIAMWNDLKRIADHLTELRDANIPVLWRPMHECDGNWFWYGKQGGERFVKLWKTMFDYFTKERKLNNLIWVLCHTGDPLKEYDPGKEYYDIAGGDTYNKGTQGPLFNKLKAIHGETIPVPYHECGTLPDPDECFKNGITWSWWMLWHTNHLYNHNKDELKRIYNHDLVITRDELPNIMEFLNVKGEVRN